MAQLLTRSVADLELRSEDGDGRTVVGRIVPYGVVAEVNNTMTGEPYREMFVRGAFAGAIKRPERIDLRYTHSDRFDNVLAQATHLEERDSGLYGAFRLYESVATRAREVLTGHAKGLSVGFFPIKSRRRGGVVERVKAYLEHVAAVATPAYEQGSEVLAIREGVVLESGEAPASTPHLDAVQAWLTELRQG